jgi:hypothetical protein
MIKIRWYANVACNSLVQNERSPEPRDFIASPKSFVACSFGIYLSRDRFSWSCSDLLLCIYHRRKRLVVCILFASIQSKTDPLSVHGLRVLSNNRVISSVDSCEELSIMSYLILDDCFRPVLFHFDDGMYFLINIKYVYDSVLVL